MSDKQEFLKQFDHIPAVYPVQGNARAAIHGELDFPTIRDEDWKYTRVSGLVKKTYQTDEVGMSINVPGSERSNQVVYINGIHQHQHQSGSLPSGIFHVSMKEATGDDKDWLTKHIGQYIDKSCHAFCALNTGYFQDGAALTVAPNSVVKDPVEVTNFTSGNERAVNVRHFVEAGTNSKATVILNQESIDAKNQFVNVVTEVMLHEGANLTIYVLQNEKSESALIHSMHIKQASNSTCTVFTVTKSGDLVRNNLRFDVEGEGCESNMFGIYFTDQKQHIDNHTYVDHQKPHCNSNELYKGVMTDQSTGVFNGKIMVRRDAQQINAFQSNQNVLLSDKATINTKPELEIYADDVKCSHGCTIGQLDEEAMFYLRSRGLDKNQAAKLLLQAFAGDVLEKMEDDQLRDEIASFIHQKFEHLS